MHVATDRQVVYEVDRIVNWHGRGGAAEFEVEWTGCDENIWEPYTNITRFGGRTLFREFVKEAGDERLRQLLPRTFGSTGPARRKRRRGPDRAGGGAGDFG